MEAWLESALSHIKKRAWLKKLLVEELPKIKDLQDSPEDREIAKQWAESIKAQWAEHGLPEPQKQRNLMTDCRKAIKAIDPDHIALQYLNFTPEQWIAINNPIGQKAAERNENQQFITDPETIVQKAIALLDSREWSEIAAGIAVCTGRRVSEILKTAQFVKHSEYSVIFTGALKRHGEETILSFEIPTLAPADSLVTALEKLRKIVDTTSMTVHEVNTKSTAVALACDRHFKDLVPARTGDDSLYTHLFRTIYALIATHWYCPVQVGDLEFRAAIQGHYFLLDEQNPELRRNLATERHYYDYLISDGNGNVDGRKGIKLGSPGVQVLKTFQKPVTHSNSTDEAAGSTQTTASKAKRTRPTIYDKDHDRLTQLHQILGGARQADTMSRVFDLAELALQVASQLETEPTTAAVTSKLDTLLNTATSTTEISVAIDTPTSVTETLTSTAEVPTLSTEVSMPDVEIPAPAIKPDAQTPAVEEAWRQIAALTQAVNTLTQQFIEERASSSVSKSPQARVTSTTNRLPSSATKPSAEPTEPKRIRTTENAEAKVNTAIDQIIAYNSTEGRNHSDKWAISISVLKKATGVFQGVIQRVFESRKDEIDRHHQVEGIGASQNHWKTRKGHNIADVVSL
jgi:hypothetical protein